MKQLLVLLSLLATITLKAQTQQGYVKTRGRLDSDGSVISGVRVSGTTIQVKDRSAVLSQKNGSFSFPVPNQNYYLQSVIKQGYVLADPDILSRQYEYSKNPLVLVLDIPGQQTDDRLSAERKIRRTLQKQLQEKEDEIEELKEQQKLSEEEYRQHLQELYDQQESNESLISEMADRYSRIDFDEVDEFNRRISQLILDGKLTEADSLLNTKGDINTRASVLRQHQAANEQAEQEIKKKQRKLEKSKELTQKELEDLAQDCYSKFEIFKMRHMNDSAAYYIELRADLDTTNVEWINDAGNYIRDYIANYSKALSYFERLLSISLKDKDKINEWIGAAFLNIGGVYEELGDYAMAQENFFKSLEIFQSISGECDLDVANCYSNIGTCFSHAGDYDKALEYNMRSLAIREANKGKHDLETATSYNNIGSTYVDLGKYDSAFIFYKKSLDIRKEYGDDTESIATGYHNMGSLLYKLGDYHQALEYLEKALVIYICYYGVNHPNLAFVLNNIGLSYTKLEEYDKAMQIYDEVLRIRLRTFGENYPNNATTYNNIAVIYKKYYHDYDKAIDYYNKSMNIIKNTVGEKHRLLGDCYNNLGGVYLEQEDYPKALECYRQAGEIYKVSVGENHPDLASCYINMGKAYRNMGDLVEAYNISGKAISIIERNSIITPYTAIIYGSYGNILVDIGDYDRALSYYESAEKMFESKYGDNHTMTKRIKDSIAIVKQKQAELR